jgi:hypothetical protein
MCEEVTNWCSTMQRYFRTSKEFYPIQRHGIGGHNEDLSRLNSLLLDKLPTREHLDNAVNLLSSKCEVSSVNPNELSDEYTYLRRYLSRKQSERFSSSHSSRKCVHLKLMRRMATQRRLLNFHILLTWQQCIHWRSVFPYELHLVWREVSISSGHNASHLSSVNKYWVVMWSI